MVTQAACPGPESILGLLSGELSDVEYEKFSSHLDLCSDCRQRIEEEMATPEFLGDVVQLCRSPEWPQETATLDRLMGDMRQQLSTAADAASVATWSSEAVTEIFDPSENPAHLGRLGCYEVVEVIGRGGMGIVLRGIDTRLNRVVAIKVLAPELASNPNARRRFSREAQAAAAVSHDHVVTIHAVDESEKLPFLVMEFVAGESLEEYVRRHGSLSIEQILRIGRQTALGLAAAHEVGLVHRDMKPANILLENGVQRVRITDFGLARAVDDVGITQTGTVSGTPLYMSPEQAADEVMDHRSDLFSLGSVLYTMCTGRAAFRAKSTVAVLKRVCEDTPRPIREVNSDVPVWLVEIIDRLVSKQPADRFQTAKEVADLLGRHLAHLQDPDNVPSPAAGKTSQEKSGARARLLLLAAVLSIVTFGVSEAVGLTEVGDSFMGIILKLTTQDGTLVIDIEDPNVEVAVDGNELVVKGIGAHEIRLKPGKHQFTEIRNGAASRQDWVTIESGGKRVLRVRRLPPESVNPESVASPRKVRPKRRPGSEEDIDYHLAVDGIAFEPKMQLSRLGMQRAVVAPGIGKLVFPKIPEQLFGQRCAMAEVEGGRLRFRVQNRSFGGEFQFISDRQRLWLLIPEAGWGEGVNDDGTLYDTHESLAKRNWHPWRTLTSYHATADPNDEQKQVKWAVFYREAANESITVRTHPNFTPMLVWGSLDLGGVVVDAQWDQRVSLFNSGASVSLGNGHHVFNKVPEFLAGRLYTKRNGYQGLVHFRVDRDQRVIVAMYDWRAMNDGSSGAWNEELTPADMLKRTGWEEVATLEPGHTHPSGKATWHFYSRDCVRGESFKLRSHKYQAPIVFSEKSDYFATPVAEGIDARRPGNAEIERRLTDAEADFYNLFGECRYAEALVIAKQTVKLAPDNPTWARLLIEAQQAIHLPSAVTPDERVSPPSDAEAGAKIKLDTAGITVRVARSIGEPAVYGVGSPVAPIRDLPAYFDARARGRHPDGVRKLVGQIAGPVQPGDTVVVEAFERAGRLIQMSLRHKAGPIAKKRAENRLKDFNPLEEARRLTVQFENSRISQANQGDEKKWLLIIARHMIARSEIEPDANEARKLREQARERILNARKLFAAEAAEAAAALTDFPKVIDARLSPKLRSEKARAENRHVSAQLQLATCTMVEALSLRLLSDERADRLSAAADEFEALYQKNRTRVGGQFARIQQARCLQFLGQPEAAVGIYSDLLASPGHSQIANRALLFSFISLNDERSDRDGVLRRASDWLAKAPLEQQRSLIGAGILWEEARAMRGATEDTPIRLLPELMGDGDGELILRSTLKLLKEVEASESRHSRQAKNRIQHVLALLDGADRAAKPEISGHSVYFQVPLPAMPTGSYDVQVSLKSDGSTHVMPQISGRITFPDSHAIGSELKRLAKHAIVLPASADDIGLSSATQSSHGLDLTAILESTAQTELVSSFPVDNAQFEKACTMLRTKEMKWALCEILNHPNADAKIHAARALVRMADADTVAVLLSAAKRNNYNVSGSESAAIHSIYRQTLKKALEASTGLKLTPKGLSYITRENGKSIRISSRIRPELFPENVDFALVENWLRQVYMSNPGEQR